MLAALAGPLACELTWRAWGYRAFFRAILGFLRLGLAKDGINFFICARMKYSSKMSRDSTSGLCPKQQKSTFEE
jgi:hypothetical protein